MRFSHLHRTGREDKSPLIEDRTADTRKKRKKRVIRYAVSGGGPTEMGTCLSCHRKESMLY